ncbi:SigE family RNA polymerase sigma factor [Solihabitans fulvus]|uniref:SigE family RNA polymerase sigma factor n=1 Tax=Solihabitans fulvus TaxID=1892852 RepID=A0A5B2XNH3_9PSEU|nr:SigE family RNA polymerase sigma factor [Solihabitans fulvus]KAA2264916.1 SigE family RNA polymerase sigma factor [Solihabitans fulvus]
MRAAEEAAFREFVAARSAALFRTAHLLTGDRHRAEDLVQNALLKTAARWRHIREPDAYVRRVMYREQVNVWRRRRILTEWSSAEVPDVSAADHSHDTDTRVVIRAAFDRLAPRQRAVLALRYFEDLPESRVADVLGVSIGTVRSTTHRALAKLRQIAPELELAGAEAGVGGVSR